jgi:hypothetical protein
LYRWQLEVVLLKACAWHQDNEKATRYTLHAASQKQKAKSRKPKAKNKYGRTRFKLHAARKYPIQKSQNP